MRDSLPHCHLLTKELVAIVNEGYQRGSSFWMWYLSNFPYVVFLINAESLYRSSLFVVDPFPHIAETTEGSGILGNSDELFGDNVGVW